jgi:serine/threonine-protein kinase
LGLIHRDLKPANVYVAIRGGEADVAKVLDFGLVKLTRDPGGVELTSDQRVSGTPLYMSPEQAVGDRSLDARSDIYSLGCMLYFVLTGQPPFLASTPFEVMMAQSRDPVVPPSDLRADIPADLEHVVLKRYPSVNALAKALAACAAANDWDSEKSQEWWGAHNSMQASA